MNTLSSPIRAEAHHASLFPSYTMHTMQCGALQTSEGKHREQTPSLYS